MERSTIQEAARPRKETVYTSPLFVSLLYLSSSDCYFTQARKQHCVARRRGARPCRSVSQTSPGR